MAALFPELARDGHIPAAAGIAAGIATGAGARGTARLRARAAAAGVPFVLLAQGLLRAPPPQGRFGRATPPCLSALVLEISGPPAPADVVTPGGVLENRGWETPALLAQAALARRALATARVGGEWWHGGAAGELPAGDGYAVVVLAEPAVANGWSSHGGPPGEAVLAAMLDQALAENPADRVVVLAPGQARGAIGRRLQPSLAAAAARAPPSSAGPSIPGFSSTAPGGSIAPAAKSVFSPSLPGCR